MIMEVKCMKSDGRGWSWMPIDGPLPFCVRTRLHFWIPAFAGMTAGDVARIMRRATMVDCVLSRVAHLLWRWGSR